MYSWGKAIDGQLGLGGIADDTVLQPRQIQFPSDPPVKLVCCGLNHTLVLTEDGQLFSCGSDDFGQIGRKAPKKKFGRVDAFESICIVSFACSGSNHNLAIDSRKCVYSWGNNDCGQLGMDVNDGSAFLKIPRHIKALSQFVVVQVACGQHHSLALVDSGFMVTWGSNQYGQLGVGHKVSTGAPTPVVKLHAFFIVQIVAGSAHSLALTQTGSLFSWGKNSFGQLGLGDSEDRCSPTWLSNLQTQHIIHAACGADHTATLTKEGGVYTFGAGSCGQLGHNCSSHQLSPKMVFDLMGIAITQLTCGRRHTLAYCEQSNRLYTFGLNGSGQLGCNSTTDANAPTITTNTWAQKVCQIAAGGDHSFLTISKGNASQDYTKWNTYDIPLYLSAETIDSICNSDGVKRTLNVIASSASCLNGSFPKPVDNGMDLIIVRQNIRKLSAISPQTLNAMKSSLAVLFEYGVNVVHPDQIRFLLLLPELTILFDTKDSTFITFNYCKIINGLSKDFQLVLAQWWSTLGAAYFVHIVNIVKDCMERVLQTRQPYAITESEVGPYLEVLRLLNQCNSDEEIISYAEFYMLNIVKYLDIEKDYLKYIYHKMELCFCRYPFLLDAKVKMRLLALDSKIQQQAVVQGINKHNMNQILSITTPGSHSIALVEPFLKLTVDRQNLVQDTVSKITSFNPGIFKKPLKIEFLGEAAIDAGGVTKEFFLLIIKEVLDPKYGMFQIMEETNVNWFTIESFETDHMYRTVGVLCGLAIYNETIIDFKFPVALYKKLLNKRVTFEDLISVKPSVARGLQELLEYEGDDFEDIYPLTFQHSHEFCGSVTTVDLIENGSNIVVTKSNRQKYVDSYIKYELETSIKAPFDKFKEGFYIVCYGKILDLFHPEELRMLVCGSEYVDFDELEKVTIYAGEFHRYHPTIKYFWEVFQELTIDQKKKFLAFLTGNDHVPITGVSSMKFIFQSCSGAEDRRLPVAHTCFNILDLPVYKSKELLKDRLLLAIENSTGFGLV